jgi:ribosomal protein S12 methylthiotransferase accessory factor
MAKYEVNVDRELYLHPSAEMPYLINEYLDKYPKVLYNIPRNFRYQSLIKIFRGLSFSSIISKKTPINIAKTYASNEGWAKIIEYLYEQQFIDRSRFYYEEVFNDEPKIYAIRLKAKGLDGQTSGTPNPSNGWYSRGGSFDVDEAQSKVIGELLERRSLAAYDDKKLMRASSVSLKKEGLPHLDLSLISQPLKWQKEKNPRLNFDENTTFCWEKMTSLHSGKKVLVPAQLVYWNYRIGSNESFIQGPITNGAGGYFTREGAILSGIYELIQRDAFLLHWLNKIPPKKVYCNGNESPKIAKLFEECERNNIKIHILDVTSDIPVPSYIAVLEDESTAGPAFSVGGGCGPSPLSSIERAITEAITIRYWIRGQRDKISLPDNFEPFTTNFDQVTRVLLWANHEMKSKFEWLLDGEMVDFPAPNSFVDEKEQLSRLVEYFKSRGNEYEVLLFEAKNKVLSELGYHSVKVVIPAIFPLYLRERFATLGSKRLREFRIKHGLPDDNNYFTIPHPFP